MKHHTSTLAIAALCFIWFPLSHAVAGSKADVPNDVTIELLGRNLIYSFSFQHMIAEQAGIEGGLSVLGGSGASVGFFSAGLRLYATSKDAAPCITAGFVGVTASTDDGPFSSSASTSYLYIGPGFEYRSAGGFVFRGTMYMLIRDGFFIWPGAQVGIAF